MRLTAAKGNMYPFADYTANPLAGKCPHDCKYCYMKDLSRFSKIREKYSGPVRIEKKDLDAPTGKHGVRRGVNLDFVQPDIPIVFVCSGHDLGAAPTKMKIRILKDCSNYPSYCYLIQSKNPRRLKGVEDFFPPNVILGTTVETDRTDLCRAVSNAPPPIERIEALGEFDGGCRKMISIEPIMEFSPLKLSWLVRKANPDFTSVGADRGGMHDLQEPNWNDVLDLIGRLEKFTAVIRKKNLQDLKKRG